MNYAIIAGKGELPKLVADALKGAKIIGFESDKPTIKTHLLTNLGAVGEILQFLRANRISKIVFAGGISRPNLKQVRPDKEGAKLLAKIVLSSAIGDDSLLSKITSYLEKQGFEIVAAEDVVKDLKTTKGVLGKVKPSKQQKRDIEIAFAAAAALGKLDIGQAVVAEDGLVLAVEAAEGTEGLISRTKTLQKSYGGVLVKRSKPGQDGRVDLPSIGIETIKQLKAAGLKGVALEAGKSLVLGRQKLVKAANEAGLFIVGI